MVLHRYQPAPKPSSTLYHAKTNPTRQNPEPQTSHARLNLRQAYDCWQYFDSDRFAQGDLNACGPRASAHWKPDLASEEAQEQKENTAKKEKSKKKKKEKKQDDEESSSSSSSAPKRAGAGEAGSGSATTDRCKRQKLDALRASGAVPKDVLDKGESFGSRDQRRELVNSLIKWGLAVVAFMIWSTVSSSTRLDSSCRAIWMVRSW